MEIQLSKDLQASVKTQHFAMINIWRLSEKLSVTPGLSGVDLNTANPKTYAAVNCSARVSRLSTFYACLSLCVSLPCVSLSTRQWQACGMLLVVEVERKTREMRTQRRKRR